MYLTLSLILNVVMIVALGTAVGMFRSRLANLPRCDNCPFTKSVSPSRTELPVLAQRSN